MLRRSSLQYCIPQKTRLPLLVFMRCYGCFRLSVTTSLIFGLLIFVVNGRAMAQNSLQFNRNRLLDTYAEGIGSPDRCSAWNQMSDSQKGVFLTTTDLLGKRSFMENIQYNYFKSEIDLCSTINTPCTLGCELTDWTFFNCVYRSGPECYAMGRCYIVDVPRTDFSVALDHVTKIWAINGADFLAPGYQLCGGGDANRIYFSADDMLIYYMRNDFAGLPEWTPSTDPAGPHSPFNNSMQTFTGGARGQTHFWSWDWQSQMLFRPGVVGVNDPHIIEMDIDYTLFHDSNPECHYPIYGRTKYENAWAYRMLGGTAEYSYNPCL